MLRHYFTKALHVIGQSDGLINMKEIIENDLENEQVEPGAKAEVEHMSRLWPSCVQPIIKKLKEDQALDFHEPLRVWWIGTGVAGSLPFHAAGQYINDFKKFQDSENTLSKIIPSYTSTIKALPYARFCASRAVKLNSSEISILVKMPTTPGHRSLPGVDHEKFAIKQITKDVRRIKTLESPMAAQVLNYISGFDIVHFACHASADP